MAIIGLQTWKPAKARIAVPGQRRRYIVSGFVTTDAPGLIVHPVSYRFGPDAPDLWTVTHRPSGLAVLPYCPDRGYAERAAVILARAHDFKRPKSELFRDAGARTLAQSFACAWRKPTAAVTA